MSENPSRQQLLEAFDGLRVADVRDGMDTCGWARVGSVDHAIRPLWRTRACGIARTARYLPYRGVVPELPPEDYKAWAGTYYREVCTYPWLGEIEPGDFVVLDVSGVDAGLMGSENTLGCLRRGARGLVSNGGVRDTDEIILQRVPFWSAFTSQSMVQGRLQFDGMDVPVCVGGVTIRPGDLVVADGDGVVAVPVELALEVAKWANKEHAADKRMRARHYQELGREPDETVR
jgi:regulator of RNase E activity RraA